MEQVDVAASDAVRLILQFLQENGLRRSMRALQEEAQISLDAVPSVQTLQSDIRHGRWDAVLQQTTTLATDAALMAELYAHVVLELAEAGEQDVAKQLLLHAKPLQHMKESDRNGFARLERIANLAQFDAKNAYGGSSKHQRRAELAQRFESEVTEIPPSRLLALLGQALKWQRMQGMVGVGENHDLFRGAAKQNVPDRSDSIVRKAAGKIKFSKASMPQCAQFSRDGLLLTSGSKDGFVEVWDFQKCTLRKDLSYQAKDEFMMHEVGVTAIGFSHDGEMLATGSEDGQVKVWRISTGICLRRFDGAHSQSIHSVRFSADGTQLLTSSFDRLVRIYGLKSGQMLKEFQGHQGYVNAAVFSRDGARVISASCDGTVKIWDTKTTECLKTIRPPNAAVGEEIDIVSILSIPNAERKDRDFVLCSRTDKIYVVSSDGELQRTYQMGSDGFKTNGCFVGCVASPRSKFLYGVTENGYMVAFDLESASVESTLQVSKGAVLGVDHHPHQNLLATFGSDGYIRLWKA